MITNKSGKRRGFTLIELLVVISIIGLLSSVVLASLNTARLKSRDAAIKTAMNQFRNLIEQSSDGNYTSWYIGNWADNATECNTRYASRGSEAVALCTNIVNNSYGTNRLYNGVNTATFSVANNYSMMASLPGSGQYYCIGSSGRSSETAYASWNSPGCYNNP